MIALTSLLAATDRAARAIPPAWPLASSVAVNPFLGQANEELATVAARLARVAGAAVTMPRSWYLDRIASGAIGTADLEGARATCTWPHRPADVRALKTAAALHEVAAAPLATVADLAAQVSGVDWPGLIAERFGAWAARYFDEGQALWAAPRGTSAYAAWREVAMRDLTPEIIGLSGFAAHVAAAPEHADDALARPIERLGITPEAMETLFHRLLMTLEGWAQYARYKLWMAELGGANDTTLTDFLAIRLLWEDALYTRYAAHIADDWRAVIASHAAPVAASPAQVVDAILQEAGERAAQCGLAGLLSADVPAPNLGRPVVQAAFCIDVRSEVFRRALEATDPGTQTIGFAGFFGLTTSHRRFASDVDELRLPVLLNPAVQSRSGSQDDVAAELSARYRARAHRAWGRFKLAAVSSFGFVEATGPVYVGKLIRDALGKGTTPAPNDPMPQFSPALDLDARIAAAESILRAMSLTSNFGRVVLLAGHGANVVNNPHASALHCGACGGYSGEVNARLLASLLNDIEVRIGLAAAGITIPADTLFVAGLHDTTTDFVTLYIGDHPSDDHRADIAALQRQLASAAVVARGERALRLPHAGGANGITHRSHDWSEVRPEWGLASCMAFIAAPRARTQGKPLGGRAFLHDYDWIGDKGFGVLELILTAPVVVASWISLQYYGSTVAPQLFGSGNKLLHNVTGGIGVIEGNSGALRTGLPWQSVHDGAEYAHEPLRLSVCIAAPTEVISEILTRHDGVRALFDNKWLHLFTLDDEGHMESRYTGNLGWEPLLLKAEADRALAIVA